MNFEERAPSDESQEPTLHPENPPEEEIEPSSMGLKIAIVVLVVVAGIAAGYGWLQHNSAQQLASERADLQASLAQTKTEEDALTAKVNALNVAQAQEEAARAQAETANNEQSLPSNEQFPPQAAAATQHTSHQAVARRAHADDPRWKQVQRQLGDQQKALADSKQHIADTQANLARTKSEMEGNIQSARTDLGGDIARNHSELVDLEKKGERNFYEFSFEKSKSYHHTGPISIALFKADPKHEFCDLQMVVNDRTISRKHVNLYESVNLYPEGYPQPLELVINRIDKNAVQGYLSEPKERAAASTPPAITGSATPSTDTSPDISLDDSPTEAQ